MSHYSPSDYYEFISIAGKCRSFPEFMMETVFRGRADLGSLEFYEKVIFPIDSDTLPEDFKVKRNPFIDISRIIKHLHDRLLEIPWRSDYFAAKGEELLQKDAAEVSNPPQV